MQKESPSECHFSFFDAVEKPVLNAIWFQANDEKSERTASSHNHSSYPRRRSAYLVCPTHASKVPAWGAQLPISFMFLSSPFLFPFRVSY